MTHSHGGYFGDLEEHDFHSPHHHGSSSQEAPSDVHSAVLVKKMLELLEQQSSAAQRTGRGRTPDATVVDPLSIAGSVGENPAAHRLPGHHATQPWTELLNLDRKLLAHLEAGIKNPFEFLQ